MWPFKRKKESPQEIAAEERLDDVTREVAWDEFDKAKTRGALDVRFQTDLHGKREAEARREAGEKT
jgi:hypothetical protein